MIGIWPFNFVADTLFLGYYLKQNSDSLLKPRSWLKILLLFALLIIYPNLPFLPLTNAVTRTIYRIAVIFSVLFFAERYPLGISLYYSLSWTALFILYNNLIFGPYIYPIFLGETTILSNVFLNYLVVGSISFLLRAMYFFGIAHFFQLNDFEVFPKRSLVISASMALIALIIQQSIIPLQEEAISISVQFDFYYFMLNVMMVLIIIIFETTRQKTLNLLRTEAQYAASQALLENVRGLEKSEKAIRALRHDLKNHIIAIEMLLEEGNVDEASDYLKSFLEEAKEPSDVFHTGNHLLDGIFRQKLGAASDNGIDVSVQLDFSQGGFIDSFDLGTLFGNLLDNALEACQKIEETDKKFIKVKGGKAANYLIFRVENSFLNNESVTSIFQSSKPEPHLHGFGLKNVKKVVLTYQGDIHREVKDGVYEMTVMIPIPEL